MSIPVNRKVKLAEEMLNRQYSENIEQNRLHLVEKSRFKNLERSIHLQRREREMADSELRKVQREAWNEEQAARSESLAYQLDKIKREELRELKLRQSLRENCPELRELESQLRTAYVSKELAAQLAEKEARRLEIKLQERHEKKKLEESLASLEETHKALLKEEFTKKTVYRQELQDQMIINEKRKRFLYDEFLREKKMIDDIVERIYAEDEREKLEKMCKMQRTKEEMDAFKRAQQLWRDKQVEEIVKENERMQEFIMKKAIEMENREAKKNEMEAIKTKLTETIAQQLYEGELKRKEREEVMLELYEEEQRQVQEEKHRANIEKTIRQRIEMRKSLLQQMQEREEKLKEEAATDARYKEEILAKMVEDQKLEQLSNEKRRRKMLENRREVERMMVERREQRAEEMQILMKLKEEEELAEKERKRIIEEERLRMLKEHVKDLIGYLPKGVLRPDDLPHLS